MAHLDYHVQFTANMSEAEVGEQTPASPDSDDSDNSPVLNDLAASLLSCVPISRLHSHLNEGVAGMKQALNMAPPGHLYHGRALNNVGLALSARFTFRRDTNDLMQAVSYFEAAVALCTEQSLYLGYVGNFAQGLLNRYWIYGDVMDLTRIIDTSTIALSVSTVQGHDRYSVINCLATAFQERFAKLGNKADLDLAMMHYHSCLDLRSPRSRHAVFGNLGAVMLLRFESGGRPQDLETAASHCMSALQLRSPGEDGYLFYLTALGVVYWRLFNAEGTIERLQSAIGYYQTAMKHSHRLNVNHSRLLANYGVALQSRYLLLGKSDDLDQAIQYLTTSLDILPAAYFGRSIALFNLGVALATRFDATGNVADLDSAIEKLASAPQLCTLGDRRRPAMLSMHGRALSARFRARGGMHPTALACMDASTFSGANCLSAI